MFYKQKAKVKMVLLPVLAVFFAHFWLVQGIIWEVDDLPRALYLSIAAATAERHMPPGCPLAPRQPSPDLTRLPRAACCMEDA